MYSLIREGDRAGDSGPMSLAIYMDGDSVRYEQDARPVPGAVIRVGSIIARTYQYQDWWQTTMITKLLINEPDYVKFETESGSIYEWRKN